MKINRRYAHLVISLIILVTVLFPLNVYGSTVSANSKTVIKMSAGSSKLYVNDQVITAEKPYLSGKIQYIPLRAVLESIGAEVNWLGNGNMNVVYNELSIDLVVGKSNYSINKADKTLPAPPVMKNKSVMIPSEFISSCFDVDITNSAKTGETIITLNNDGSLTDLSFLTGGISKPKAGNSYFGWNVNMPKGSTLTSQSFNSKNLQFENVHHGIIIDITIDLNDGKTLAKHYEEIKNDPYDILQNDLMDSSMNNNAKPPYIELYYTDSYDEAVYHRIFANDKYFYNLIITSYNESNPDVLKNDKYITDLMDSFKLDYKGDLADTTDFSNVKSGLAQYNNYITSDSTGKKFNSWDMSVLAEWDILESKNNNPYMIEFGASQDEKVSIELISAKKETDVDLYGKDTKSFYDSNFNPALYTFKKAETSAIAGLKTYNMEYGVKIGETQYSYDERFIISGGLVFDVTFKAKADVFEKKRESYLKMLVTFNPSTKDTAELITEMDKYFFNEEKNRMGKDENIVNYENKASGWSAKFPGNWLKNSSQGSSTDMFYNSKTGALIMVESQAKKLIKAVKTDQEIYFIMNTVVNMGLNPVKTETIQSGGRSVKVYKYRIEDKESANFADVYYYIFENDTYSFCFMSTIPDLTSSSGNLESMGAIWNSFSIENKPQEKQ